MKLPQKIRTNSKRADERRRSPAHRAWVRLHACSACGSHSGIECAHVRSGTDGGTGIKPSDRWCISLCRDCHGLQHAIGEARFETAFHIDMKKIAEAFFAKSPHQQKLEGRQ